MIEAVSNADLKTALKDHLGETKGQIKTLQAVFKSIGKKASGEKCDAIEGLIKETEGVIEEAKGPVARHAAIIGIPFAWAHLKLAAIALWPIGKIIVPAEDAPLRYPPPR